ncbi:MAG: MBL fold metallo-hydrolase [Armatimonadota bacterium]|jgi:ribonuclease BN (tRNA processing enzyme)
MTTEHNDMETLRQTSLTFVGTASCTPPAGNETACFLLNGHVLIDCGWCAALSLLDSAGSATNLDAVLITHCHHDHYMGLASVFFYRRMNQRKLDSDAELRVFGPAEDIERVVEHARAYLQVDRFSAVQTTPEVVAVEPGASFELGEFEVRTAATRHPVQGMAYRFTDTRTGATIGISGDTAFVPELAEFFRGVDVLVMEAAAGLNDPDPESATHSSVRQSATIARDAEVGDLYIVHTTAPPDEVLAAAREVFPRSHLPGPRTTLML